MQNLLPLLALKPSPVVHLAKSKTALRSAMKIIESTVHQLLEDLEPPGRRDTDKNEARLMSAAKALPDDYSNDKELTSFTALDFKRENPPSSEIADCGFKRATNERS